MSQKKNALAGNAQRLNSASGLNRLDPKTQDIVAPGSREYMEFHNNELADPNVAEAIERTCRYSELDPSQLPMDDPRRQSVYNGEEDEDGGFTTHMGEGIEDLSMRDQLAIQNEWDAKAK